MQIGSRHGMCDNRLYSNSVIRDGECKAYWLGMVTCGHEIYLPFSNTQGRPRPGYDSVRRPVARIRGIAAPADLAKFADFLCVRSLLSRSRPELWI